MNTYTNSTHPEKKRHLAGGNELAHNSPVMIILLALVLFVAFAAYAAKQAPVIRQADPAPSYSNALEMQYAQPWITAQNKPTAPYSNALELQYAQPWLDSQKKSDCQSSMELLYACEYGGARP